MDSTESNSVSDHRPTAEFHPSPWGDFFLTHVFHSDEVVRDWNEKIEELKPQVLTMLLSPKEGLWEKLNLVDVIGRLGIGYHFEGEIERLLQQVYVDQDGHDLSTISLRFRLLRQYGYNTFKRFKTEDGESFKEELVNDIEGLLSLYEAAYMRIQGETILDEAIHFTKLHLATTKFDDSSSSSQLAKRISHALERPLRKGVAKLEQLFFITIYEQMHGHDETLLTLAKLSFNVVQNMYQKELKVLTKLWIELDLIRRGGYARDKLIEVYFWAIGSMWEPKFSLARCTFTRATILYSVYDDTYNAYGKINELELLTDAIKRWDTDMKGVNYKMKMLFEATVIACDELDLITSNDGRPYCLEYRKLSIYNLVRWYLEEARWLAKSYVPTLDEYRQVSSFSTAYQAMVWATLCGLGELGTKQVFDWLLTKSKILAASSDQCRLMDDIQSHQFEQKRGHAASSVECYMTQYKVSREEAVNALNDTVEEDWKIVNEELLNPKNRNIPKDVLSLFLGYEQIMDVLYKYSDGYTHSNTTTKDTLTDLFVTALPVD
ncbi:Probable terpene synthase 3 [Linum perenne]